MDFKKYRERNRPKDQLRKMEGYAAIANILDFCKQQNYFSPKPSQIQAQPFTQRIEAPGKKRNVL